MGATLMQNQFAAGSFDALSMISVMTGAVRESSLKAQGILNCLEDRAQVAGQNFSATYSEAFDVEIEFVVV